MKIFEASICKIYAYYFLLQMWVNDIRIKASYTV
jgi:hypothetical protein